MIQLQGSFLWVTQIKMKSFKLELASASGIGGVTIFWGWFDQIALELGFSLEKMLRLLRFATCFMTNKWPHRPRPPVVSHATAWPQAVSHTDRSNSWELNESVKETPAKTWHIDVSNFRAWHLCKHTYVSKNHLIVFPETRMCFPRWEETHKLDMCVSSSSSDDW